MKIGKKNPKEVVADLKLIVAQGEAILARLELIDQKLEERKRAKELEDER